MQDNRIFLKLPDLIGRYGIFCDGDWIESKDQDINGDVRLIQLADIGDGVFKDKSDRFLTYKRAINLNCTFLSEGDILIARLPDPLGRSCIFPLNSKRKYITAVDICILRVNETIALKKFINFLINSPQIRFMIRKLETGTTRKRVSRSNLGTIDFPTPPLPEQRAIVAKIELLFSELDSGVENLKKAQAQLKVYRQAVLKWAFEGKLTKEWRKQQKDLPTAETLLAQFKAEREDQAKKNGKPLKPITPLSDEELAELPKLPKGWMWSRLGEVIEEPKYGTSKKCDYKLSGKAVLRIPNICDGFINTDDLKFAEFNEQEIEAYKLKAGNLLIIRSNGSINLVGKGALITKREEEFLYAGYLICLRPFQKVINSKYLLSNLSSYLLRNQIESKAKSTSGVNNINSGELKSLIIPLCPIPEQNLIIQDIEDRLSVCDKLEETIAQSLQQAEFLRQSILKKAFSGQLLTETELEETRKAPDWEPAEKLLERIKTEKEIQKTGKIK